MMTGEPTDSTAAEPDGGTGTKSARHADVPTEAERREAIADAVGFDYEPFAQDSSPQSRRPAAFTSPHLGEIAKVLGVRDVLGGAWTRADAIAALSGAAGFPMTDEYVYRDARGCADRVLKPGVAAIQSAVETEADTDE
jgi:hypothetical protein